MRVSEIKLVTGDESCQLQAMVSSSALKEPFLLWYRFPVSATRFITADCANPWVAALLLPAMWLGERLEVLAPISPKLFRSLMQIQAIYRAWLPALSEVEVEGPLRIDLPPMGREVGLFFSSGVDSWYSLLKNDLERSLNEDVITQLIVVHGADIDVGDSGKKNVFDAMLANANAIARQLGKEVLPVATNVRLLYYKFGISWHWAQAGALASVGLAAETMFKKFYMATWITYAEAASYPELSAGGCHPLLDPLWSTEGSVFVHDGCEATRLEKIRILTKFPLVMDTLRVCWANDSRHFNCGRCAKCLRTMLGLYVSGALGQCRTLPPTIDPELLRKVTFLFPHEFVYFQELLNEVGRSAEDNEIRAMLTEGIARGKLYFENLDKARRSIDKLVPLEDSFILVDEEAIRFELGAARRVIPFLEREGVWWGRPPNDETAVHELERFREAGAKFMLFWSGAFWWLEYYAGLNRHLRSTYRCILESDSLIVFDLRSVTESNRA